MSEPTHEPIDKSDAQMYTRQITECLHEHRVRYGLMFVVVYLAVVLGMITAYKLWVWDIGRAINRSTETRRLP